MASAAGGDLRKDERYFETKIRNISDADLAEALRGPVDGRERILYTDAEEFLTTAEEAARSVEPQRQETIEGAEKILAHEIVGWGDVSIRHGEVVDFNANYGQAGKYGFHFWRWSRPLLWAFLLTRDEKYLREFESLFNQWYEQRERVKGEIEPLDVIWYELGLSIRSRIFLEFYGLAKNIAEQTRQRLLKTFLGAARWLHEEQKLGNRLGNWQIMGATGLASIALTLGEFREAEEWLKISIDRLAWHVERDFYPDGCHWERCPSSYMVVAYGDIQNVATLLARSEHEELSRKLSEPLKRCRDFFHAILGDDEMIPGINDGRRVELPRRIRAQLPIERAKSTHFPASGFTVMRDESHYMLINQGPPAGGHTHLDAMNFELHAFGKPMAIDSGIGLTYDDPLYATWYRKAVAHNMLTVGDADPDRKVTQARDVFFTSAPSHDYFAGTHHGYEQSHGVVHRRHVVFVKPRFFVIYEVVSGAAGRRLAWHLHGPNLERVLIVASDRAWERSDAQGMASVGGARLEDVKWVRFASGQLTEARTHFAVLLYPFEGSVPGVEFSCSFDEKRARFRISCENGIDEVEISNPMAAGEISLLQHS